MPPALPTVLQRSPDLRWSLYAGGYMFAWGLLTALALDQILGLLADTLHIPAATAPLIFALPVLLVSTGMWWAVVERRRAYSYLGGGAFGFVTALATGLLWTGAFVRVWGFEMLFATPVAMLVGVVLGVALVVGVLSALPLMFARRRVGG